MTIQLTIWDRHHPKDWIAQMGEHGCGNPEVSGSISGPVKCFLLFLEKFISTYSKMQVMIGKIC